MAQTSKVAGVVQIDGIPAQRKVRAFGYNETAHTLDGGAVTLSKSLGHATSNPATGEYTINLLGGYGRDVFVVAFDDYGEGFSPGLALNVGDRIHPTTPNGHVWECTGAGTLPAEEPTWIVDTETSQIYGTAAMIARPFYRPMVHGPVVPEVNGGVADHILEIINTEPALFWTLDESAPPYADSVSGELLAAHNGQPTPSIALCQGSAQSLEFGGTKYASFPSTVFNFNADFTLSFWIRFTEANNLVVMDCNANQGLSVQIGAPTNVGAGGAGTISLSMGLAGSQNQDYVDSTFGSPEVINDDLPHHVVFTANDNVVRVYIDGALSSEHVRKLQRSSPVTNNKSFDVGSRAGNYGFGGSVDFIALHQKALTSAEVYILYNAGSLT